MEIPYGSALFDPEVMAARKALAQIQPPQEEIKSSPFPQDSAFGDPRVQAAMQALAQIQPPQEEIKSSPYPQDSAFGDPRVQAAMQALAQIQPQQQEARQNPHPADSTFNDPRVAAQLQGIAEAQSQPPVHTATVKNALNGGELSPDMFARYDLPRYQTGCEKLVNMIPLPGGGITRRPGFVFVSGAGDGGGEVATRLLPFTYSSDTAMMLMFLANSGGGQIYILDRDGRQGAKKSCVIPYKKDELATLSFCQCGKVIYLAHAKHKPAKITWDGSAFKYEELVFRNKTPIPSIASLQIVGIPNEAWGWRRYKITAVNDETGEESLPSEMQEIPTSALNSVFKVQLDINPVPGCAEYRVYRERGAEYGFIGRITEGTAFYDEGYDPDVTDQPPEDQEFFTKPGDYPAVVFLHQQRLGWAATDNDPLTIWLSQSSNFECLASKKPPQDDDGIEATLASTQANRILWCASDRSGLAIGTAGEEWYLTGADGAAGITPNSLSFQPQTRYGSSPGSDATRANSSLLFVQRGGRNVRDLGYTFQADKYEAQDLTLLARHIFQHKQIVDICWQGSPCSILWVVDSKGGLSGLTYMPEQEIIAWHRHETASFILSCATLDDSAGRSRLWIVSRYLIDGAAAAHIEMLGLPFDGPPGDLAAWQNHVPQFTDGQARHPYTASCIPCLPETGMENGATTMRVKKITAIKARVLNSAPFKCKVSGMYAADTKPAKVPPSVMNFSQKDRDFLTRWGYVAGARDWACPIAAGFRDNAKLELIFDDPAPVTVLGLTIVMEVAREAGGQI